MKAPPLCRKGATLSVVREGSARHRLPATFLATGLVGEAQGTVTLWV